MLTTTAGATRAETQTLVGSVANGFTGLGHYKVSLYAAGPESGWPLLGSDTTDKSGSFRIAYSLPPSADAPLFVEAKHGRALLASAIGSGSSVPTNVVVNERTTVAAGTAFAQFVDDERIAGNRYGMANAVHMAANLADPQTGAVGAVLATTPNGAETSTLATFNSLANAVASCISSASNGNALFRATAPPGGRAPKNVLQAVANIAKYPSYPADRAVTGDPVFALSALAPVNQPALADAPTSCLLFLEFTGGPYRDQARDNLMNGPGNFAIDEQGFVSDDRHPDGQQPVLRGRRAQLPEGMAVGDPISPDTGYRSDALERITGGQIDPSGNIWLTNNWKRDANPVVNPFGNAIVVAIGAAAPVKTPLIGPPVGF